MMQPRRDGAALVLSLLVLLVLECVVVGTLHLTQMERRLADNGALALRLRLAAENAARAAAGTWPTQLDSIALGDVMPMTSSITAARLSTQAFYQRIDSSLVLVFGVAKEPSPRFGEAHASLLVERPLLSESMLPLAAFTAGGAVHVRGQAALSALPDASCVEPTSASALQLSAMTLLQLDAGGSVNGNIDVATPASDWAARIRHIAALHPASTVTDSAGRTVYAGSGQHVIAVVGDVVIPSYAIVRGIILVTGQLIVEAGAMVEGMVVVLGDADIHGQVRFSSCSAGAAIRQKALHRPRPHAARATIPGF